MRKELDLERRDLFDAGDGTGAGSKRKHASSQPLGVAQTLALEQVTVRVKYLQAVAQTNADGVARIGTKRLSANMRIQPEAKAGLLELANTGILGAPTIARGQGAGQVLSLPHPRWCLQSVWVCARGPGVVCAQARGPGALTTRDLCANVCAGPGGQVSVALQRLQDPCPCSLMIALLCAGHCGPLPVPPACRQCLCFVVW